MVSSEFESGCLQPKGSFLGWEQSCRVQLGKQPRSTGAWEGWAAVAMPRATLPPWTWRGNWPELTHPWRGRGYELWPSLCFPNYPRDPHSQGKAWSCRLQEKDFHTMGDFLKGRIGTYLVVQWLRLYPFTTVFLSLLRELRSHMPHGTAKKINK